MEQPREIPNPSIDLRSFAFSTTSSSSNHSRLSKPRLVKQRRRVPRPVDSCNPFHSPNLSNGTDSAPSSGKGFVFGSSNSFPASYSSATAKDGNFMGIARRSESGLGAGKEACTSEMEKLHIGTKGVGVGTTKEGAGGEFIFGQSSPMLGQAPFNSFQDKFTHLNLGSSVGGSGFSQADKAGAPKSGIADEKNDFKHHVDVNNFNMNSYGSGNGWQKMQDPDTHNFNAGGKGVFTFGRSKNIVNPFDDGIANKVNENFKKLNIESQLSKNLEGIHKDSEGGTGSTFLFDDDIANKFPENFKKLNIENQSSKKMEEINKDSDGGSTLPETIAHHSNAGSKSDFTFGRSNFFANSFDDDMKIKFPEKFNNLNVNNQPSKNLEDVNRDSEPGSAFYETDAINDNAAGKGVFTFGLSKNVANSFDDDISKKIPENFKKLNIENQPSKNLEDTNKVSEGVSAFPDLHETSVKKTFTPENMSNNADKFTSDNFLHDTLKLNNGDPNILHLPKKEALFAGIGEKVNSEPYQNVKHNDSITGSSILYSKFLADNQGIATGSSYSSFTASGFTSGAADFTFTCSGSGESYLDSKTLNKDIPFPSEDNMFTEMRQNLAFSMKTEAKGSRSKNRKGKSRRTAQSHQRMDSASFQKEKISNENSKFDSPGHFSPMDSSPYEEILVPETHSGPSVTPSGTFDSQHSFKEGQNSAAQHLEVTEVDNSIKNQELQADDTKDDSECFLDAKSSFVEDEEDGEEEIESSRRDKEGSKDNTSLYYSSYSDLTENKFIFSSSSSIRNHPSEGNFFFTFSSALNNGSHDAKPNESAFKFATDASTQHTSSLLKQLHKRKSRIKNTKNSYKTTSFGKINNVDSFPSFPSPHLSSSLQSNSKGNNDHEGALFASEKISEKNVIGSKDPEIKGELTSSTILSTAAREACENWRLKGNQAYTKGNLSKAEDYYTRGLNCVSPNENYRSCSHLLVLCYSNRAATRMSLNRMREALNDCLIAIAIEPNFHKAQLRAANCYLSLGEIEEASNLFGKCLQLFIGDKPGSNFLEEASDGLRKAKLVAEGMCRSSEILKTRMCSDVKNALATISEMLLISPQSERLLEMKAEALLLLQKYDEVIELCEKTVKSSKINSSFVRADGDTNHIKTYEIWRWHLISKSYFYLGKLEEAVQLLQSHDLVGPTHAKCSRKSLEPFALLFDTIKELLRLKVMGNNAFKEGRHLEAVEHYTAALACSVESRPFAAICFCNRAAAYQALNQITDAIADCSLAIALDENYPKAISRRATLYELIRDYDQANNDLGRLISLLKKQSGAMVSPSSNGGILTHAHTRLSCVQDEARKGIPLNMYKILGVESSSTTVDIKKAYRKAALKHHPDKVVQFLVKGEKSNDNIWNDVSDVVHRDAGHVFKMIGEAYSILSDSTKREQYDAEEERRIILKKGESLPQRHPGEHHYSRSDKSNMRRHSESAWNSHGRQRQRWSESAYSSRYYYY